MYLTPFWFGVLPQESYVSHHGTFVIAPIKPFPVFCVCVCVCVCVSVCESHCVSFHGSCIAEPGLGNFERYFSSLWDECNCAVVWAFFGIAFLWDWNENWSFPVLWHCWVFQICWHIVCSTFTASSFRIWKCSTGIPSPPLALFIVMLSKANLASHSRMSGSRWVITPSWLSVSWRCYLLLLLFFVQFFCVFMPPFLNIFCFCLVHTISVLYWAHLCMKCSLGTSNFLKRSLVFPILLLFFGTLHSDAYIFAFLLCFFTCLLTTPICEASPERHCTFLYFFSMGMVLIPVSCTISEPPVIVHQALCLSDLVP